MNELRPSQFIKFPINSVIQNAEAEQVALNIMIIRKRLGDKWQLSLKEYEDERGDSMDWEERDYFKIVYPLIEDANGAKSFCNIWAECARSCS